MSQPPTYSLSFSFTNFSANYPASQQPGVSLDNEFRSVKVTLDAVLNNLALIQRDDGALRNQVVTPDSLSPEVAVGLRSVSDWATATAYIVRDAVWTSNKLYICDESHTSAAAFATDLTAGKWTLLVDIAPYAEAAAEAAVTQEVLDGISLDVDLGPINTALASKAGLADTNAFTGANTFSNSVTLTGATVLSRGAATSLSDYLAAKPTDYGAGKPGIFLRKSATADTWELVIEDGAAGSGPLLITASAFKFNGYDVVTEENGDVQTLLRRAKVFGLMDL